MALDLDALIEQTHDLNAFAYKTQNVVPCKLHIDSPALCTSWKQMVQLKRSEDILMIAMIVKLIEKKH